MSRVFIGVGHGGKDPGAVANGLRESDVNLVMALAMQKELERHGVTVGISRTKDEDDSLTAEISKANAFKPDLAVEVHNNAGGGDGFEVYYQTNGYKSDSLALAQAIEKQTIAIGQNSRGCKTRLNGNVDYFGWLRQVNCPAVLCEGVFLDNKTDILIIDTIEKQEAFGIAYAKAVLEFLKIAYIAEKKETATTSSKMYGVVKQVVALSSKEQAENYASQLNAQSSDLNKEFYKVIEIVRD